MKSPVLEMYFRPVSALDTLKVCRLRQDRYPRVVTRNPTVPVWLAFLLTFRLPTWIKWWLVLHIACYSSTRGSLEGGLQQCFQARFNAQGTWEGTWYFLLQFTSNSRADQLMDVHMWSHFCYLLLFSGCSFLLYMWVSVYSKCSSLDLPIYLKPVLL
jgi:hypothetical protein